QVRRALGLRRVGHLGTLDPFAVGLLVIVVGRATRLAPYAADWAKSYEGVIRLGRTTATDDATGPTAGASDAWQSLDRARVEAAVAQFRGAYEQRPPAYSAVKVAGERAYRRAAPGQRGGQRCCTGGRCRRGRGKTEGWRSSQTGSSWRWPSGRETC